MTSEAYSEGGYGVYIQKAMARNRELVTPIDLLRGSDFTRAVLSGANNYTSGQSLQTVAVSNVVAIRPILIHLQSRETTPMTVLFRDGSITGTVVAGPYVLNPIQERVIPTEQLLGMRFTSGIYAVVISGVFGAGIQTYVGYVNDPDPNAVGGLIE